MVRLSSYGLILLVSLTALSGCIGGDEEVDTGPKEAEQAVVTETTGSVTGQIISVELEVMVDVTVGLTNRTGGVEVTQTDSRGNFTFNGVPTGQYRIQVQDDCCKVKTEQITVEAGKVTTINMQVERLTPADLKVPFMVEEEYKGLVGCSFSVLATHSSTCGAADPNHNNIKRFNVSEGLQELVVAMEWKPAAQSVTDELKLRFQEVRNGRGYDYVLTAGPSPIIEYVSDADITNERAMFQNINETLDIQIEVHAGSNNLVYQQEFTVYYYTFYHQLAPGDFNPLPDS